MLVVDCFALTNFACSVSDSLGNSFTLRIDANSGGSIRQRIWTSAFSNAGSDVFTFTGGSSTDRYEIQVVQYTGITGVGTNGVDTSFNNPSSFSSTVTITTSAPSVVYEGWDVGNGGTSSCASLSPVTGATIFSFNCDTSTSNALNSLSAQSFFTGGAGTFPFTVSWTGGTNGNNFQIHAAIELDLAPATAPATATQCYGNCGNPPITLANTNSTHTVNFNQSITLFYQFQSNLNGFLLNVTVSMAKSYAALPNGPAFGVYTIQSCPLGQAPFSSQCPGLLQAQSAGQNTFSPPKGKISFSGLRIPVSNGQWVGIALSASLAGLDVNDTNTNVNLFQTNEGKIPSSIQAPSSLGNSKVGLWAWINGNVISGIPPTSPSSGNCGPGLDFILACAVNSLCTVVTSQCQTGSSILLIVILTIFSIAILLGIFSYWLPGMNISTKGMGEFAVLIFIGWFVAFAAYGLLLPYMIILMFFVIAWLFLGRSRGTGPI